MRCPPEYEINCYQLALAADRCEGSKYEELRQNEAKERIAGLDDSRSHHRQQQLANFEYHVHHQKDLKPNIGKIS